MKTGKTLVKPYTILNKQDLKIAVVGLTTEDTAKLGNPEYLHNVKFEDPTTVAKATLKELNEKVKPDVKIALTHMGYYYDAKHGSNAPGDVSLARNLDKGAFDMIIGGHSHDPIVWMTKVYGLKIINQLSHVNQISKWYLDYAGV